MNEAALRTLEFDRIREVVVSLAGSPSAQEQLERLSPSADRPTIDAALNRTDEAITLLRTLGLQPYHDLPDVREILPLLRVKGVHLEPLALLALASFMEGAGEIGLRAARVTSAPGLAQRASEVRDLGAVCRSIRRAILPHGEIADEASPRLAELRRALLRLKSQLHAVMDGYLRSKDTERLLQEQLVTTRNDRSVLLVKAEHRGQLPGVVHGASSSGQSLFVEPLPAVELNNDIVAAAGQEQQEIVRILQALSAQVGAHVADLERTQAVMTELDAAQARARLADLMKATRPTLVPSLELELLDARHPLLLASVCAALGQPERVRSEPVAVTLRLPAGRPVLVIGGPNTGGKTVALKTVGLLALMAQAGLHVPAAPGSRLPIFKRVFADIGDDQSIAADLSTFSAHLRALVAMTRDLQLPALVLLDEVGSGTDPREGGPLGVSVVEHFRKAGALVVATTHDGLMKNYAQTTPGVACASFGYDPQTYAPTYRLNLDEPGRSLALEMAERLGLPAGVVADARSRLSESEARADVLLRKLDADQAALAAERVQVAQEREALQVALQTQQRTERELLAVKRREIESFVRDLRRRGDEAVRKTADAVHQAVRKVEESRRSAQKAGDSARGEALAAIRTAQEELLAAPDLQVAVREAETPALKLVVGGRARVRSLGVIGEVLALAHGQAELAVGGKRLRVPEGELSAVDGATSRGLRRTELRLAVGGRSNNDLQPPAEVKLVGLRVDEALPRLDKALDDATLGDRHELRVIHGFGEGKLRKAVAEFLDGHPHVATFRLGQPNEGGAGATVVELKS